MTPKPQPKPFNPPRESFTHMRKSQVKSGANTRNKSNGKNAENLKAQFGNHKNMMLEGDSEYSDIDINSDEEQ